MKNDIIQHLTFLSSLQQAAAYLEQINPQLGSGRLEGWQTRQASRADTYTQAVRSILKFYVNKSTERKK